MTPEPPFFYKHINISTEDHPSKPKGIKSIAGKIRPLSALISNLEPLLILAQEWFGTRRKNGKFRRASKLRPCPESLESPGINTRQQIISTEKRGIVQATCAT